MDDLSVFRRFFVVQNLLSEIIGVFNGGIQGAASTNARPQDYQITTTPAQETDAPPSLGNANTIKGTRPPRTRLRRPPPPSEHAVRYPFPAGD